MSVQTRTHERRTRLRRAKFAAATLIALAALFNGVCVLHARAMTTFVDAGERTPDPEELGVFGKLRALALGVEVPRPVNDVDPSSIGLDFATHLIDGREGARLELWHVPVGNPEGLVILCHGYAGSKARLLETARALHDASWAVLLPDFEGSGGSSGHTTTLGYGEAGDVVATARWAREHLGIERPVLYGLSMGSAAILRAVAVEDLAVRGIVVETPFDRMLSTVRHRFDLMGVPSFPSAELLVFWGGVIHGFDALEHDPVDYAADVNAPTLVLAGALDQRVRVEEAEAVARAASAELVVFDEVGHAQMVAAAPARWRNAVLPFLASLPAE